MLISLTSMYSPGITVPLNPIMSFYNPFTWKCRKSSLSSVAGRKVQISDAAQMVCKLAALT